MVLCPPLTQCTIFLLSDLSIDSTTPSLEISQNLSISHLQGRISRGKYGYQCQFLFFQDFQMDEHLRKCGQGILLAVQSQLHL